MKNKMATGFLFIVLVAANGADAFAERIEFRGTLIIAQANKACTDQGWPVGMTARGRFYPADAEGNDEDELFTGLSWYYDYYAENYGFEGRYTDLRQGSFIDVFGVGVGRGAFSFDAKMLLTYLSPATIRSNTNFVRMVGKIRGFDGIPGCNIKFRGSFTKRLR
jgi:hypothetical protein